MPIQGPQELSSNLAPEDIKTSKAPLLAKLVNTCFDPGEITRETSSATVLPSKIDATFIISI